MSLRDANIELFLEKEGGDHLNAEAEISPWKDKPHQKRKIYWRSKGLWEEFEKGHAEDSLFLPQNLSNRLT